MDIKSNKSCGCNGRKIDHIQCSVTNCAYHDQHQACTADHINIGPQYASCSQDTVCATFKPNQ